MTAIERIRAYLAARAATRDSRATNYGPGRADLINTMPTPGGGVDLTDTDLRELVDAADHVAGAGKMAPTGTRDLIEREATEAQISSACLSYRHDFGLLEGQERNAVMFAAKEWLRAWRRAIPPAAQDGEAERLRAERDAFRSAFENDDRDVRYFSKMLAAQSDADALRAEAEKLRSQLADARELSASQSRALLTVIAQRDDLLNKVEKLNGLVKTLAFCLQYADGFIRSNMGGLHNPVRTAALAEYTRFREGQK